MNAKYTLLPRVVFCLHCLVNKLLVQSYAKGWHTKPWHFFRILTKFYKSRLTVTLLTDTTPYHTVWFSTTMNLILWVSDQKRHFWNLWTEGTGRKRTFELDKTLGSQLNRTHLRIWNVQIFDLVPPSGQKIDFKNMDFSIIFYFFDLLRTFFGCKWHKINERI